MSDSPMMKQYQDAKAACPNCGFAENVLVDARLNPVDRVVIDRWPLLFRRARRGEVVAAQVPGGGSDLAIKRVAGLPGERIAIRGGDLFANEQIVRKSPTELRSVRVLVHHNNYQPRETKGLPPRWRPAAENSSWTISRSSDSKPGPPSGSRRSSDGAIRRVVDWVPTSSSRLPRRAA